LKLSKPNNTTRSGSFGLNDQVNNHDHVDNKRTTETLTRQRQKKKNDDDSYHDNDVTMGNAISLSEPDEVLFAIWRKRRLEEEEEDQRYFDEISSLIDRCKRHSAEEADASTTRTKRSRRSGKKAVSLMTKDKDGKSGSSIGAVP
jgi:hypothetical protein